MFYFKMIFLYKSCHLEPHMFEQKTYLKVDLLPFPELSTAFHDLPQQV